MINKYAHLDIYIFLFVFFSKVDSNDTYDDLAVLNADAEEKYFDDEDPESINSDSNS